MMDTNAVLSIAFSIVSNFTQVVYVPPDSVPQNISDLEAYHVGRGRYFPLDIYLRHKRGTEFWIMNGAVNLYMTPRSFFRLQDPKLIPKFIGSAKLSSNQVVELAGSSVRRLVKNGDSFTNVTPVVKLAKPYQGGFIPFYEVKWADPTSPKYRLAEVEVDAQTGLIVYLFLF